MRFVIDIVVRSSRCACDLRTAAYRLRLRTTHERWIFYSLFAGTNNTYRPRYPARTVPRAADRFLS